MYLGIDNGINGGLVLIDRSGKAIDKWAVPSTFTINKQKKKRTRVDEKLLSMLMLKICTQYKIKKIFIEQPLMLHTQLPISISSTWYTFGVYAGILSIMGKEWEVITVRDWQKFIGKKPKDDSKVLSINHAMSNSGKPWEFWLKSPRCKKPHDGFTDAYGIAAYGVSKLES